jgi:hypothetical protein
VHNSLVYSLPSQIDCNKAPSAVYSDFSSLHCTFPFPISCNNNSSVLSNDNEFQKWHLRLANAHSNAVKSVLQMCNVSFNNKNTDLNCTFLFNG